jgi:hypothetical protein
MDRGTLLAASGTWCGFVAAAIANGAARERVLRPAVGRAAEPLSVATLSAAILAGTHCFVRRAAPQASARELLAVGVGWTGATVAFEFLFGHYVAGAAWEELLANYDLPRGRLWPLVLLVTLLAPAALGRRARRGTLSSRR